MLDGRILAAVFASLAAIAAAVGGGHVDAGSLKTDNFRSAKSGFSDLLPGPLKSFGDFFQNPEPETEMSAVLEVDDLGDQRLTVDAGRLFVKNLTSTSLDSKTLHSDESIVFYGFSGWLEAGQPLELKGRSKGLVSSGVNVSGSLGVSEDVDTEFVRIDRVERSALSFDSVTGRVESNSTSANIRSSDTSLEIDSFSGNISIFSSNGTVVLRGKVHSLTAGEVSFGS